MKKVLGIKELKFYPVNEDINNMIMNKIDEYDENKKSKIITVLLSITAILCIADILFKRGEVAIWVISAVLIYIVTGKVLFINDISIHSKIKYIKESIKDSQFQVVLVIAEKFELVKSELIDINGGRVIKYDYELYAFLKTHDDSIVNESVICVIDNELKDRESIHDFEEGNNIYILRYKHNNEFHYYGIKSDSKEYFENNLKNILNCSHYKPVNRRK